MTWDRGSSCGLYAPGPGPRLFLHKQNDPNHANLHYIVLDKMAGESKQHLSTLSSLCNNYKAIKLNAMPKLRVYQITDT